MNYEKKMYALQDVCGSHDLIGIDVHAGGYPWIPNNMHGVWLSDDPNRLLHYMRVFPGQFKLVKITITVEPADD